MTETGTKNSIFTHVLYHHFCNPLGFNFDVYSLDDDPDISYMNLIRKGYNLASYFRKE